MKNIADFLSLHGFDTLIYRIGTY